MESLGRATSSSRSRRSSNTAAVSSIGAKSTANQIMAKVPYSCEDGQVAHPLITDNFSREYPSLAGTMRGDAGWAPDGCRPGAPVAPVAPWRQTLDTGACADEGQGM
jgi:hypothetical protein